MGFARRTSHMDMTHPPDGGLVLSGAARDVVSSDGDVSTAATAEVTARLDRRHTLVEVVTAPSDARVDGLAGRTVGRGFRAAVDDVLADAVDRAAPLYLLLDDLPVATLISGYALLYRGDPAMDTVDPSRLQADLCAGWATEATMLSAFRATGRIPVPQGPLAADVVPADEAADWHDMPPLDREGAMRRQRLVEVDDGGAVRAMFRDTHVDADGATTVLHEYFLRAAVDLATLVLSDVVATPGVLPWTECPSAAASASRLDGHATGALRDLVRREFTGTTTCTHLNDLLRSLADVGALVDLLPAANPTNSA